MEAEDVTRSTLREVRSAVMSLPSTAIAAVQGQRSENDAFAEVRLAGVMLDAAHDALEVAVGYARDAGHSWAEIGAVLGITRQGAEQHFAER